MRTGPGAAAAASPGEEGAEERPSSACAPLQGDLICQLREAARFGRVFAKHARSSRFDIPVPNEPGRVLHACNPRV